VVAFCSATSVHADGDIDKLEGSYTHRLMDNSNETLIIFKLSPVTAYFEADVDRCYLSGIAELQSDGSLLYREDTTPIMAASVELDERTTHLGLTKKDQYWCELGIHPGAQKITFTDSDGPHDQQKDNLAGTCAIAMCGGRGGFESTYFKRSTHHKMTPKKVAVIKKSEGFQEAMKKRERYLNHVPPDPI
jgi:hypothetical protein